MKLTPKQKHVGKEILVAADEMTLAKRISKLNGPLARSVGADLEAVARRKIINLSRLAEKYMISKDSQLHNNQSPVDWHELALKNRSAR